MGAKESEGHKVENGQGGRGGVAPGLAAHWSHLVWGTARTEKAWQAMVQSLNLALLRN